MEDKKVVFKSVHEAKAASTECITVYTDGSCLGNPGPGGYCAVIVRPNGTLTPLVGSAKETTNNQMELMGAIEALEQFQDCGSAHLRIISDSEYLVKGMTERIKGWEQRGWKKADGKPVENVGYWQRLKVLSARHKIEWVWVRGHDGNQHNELAHKLAKGAATKVALAA